MKIPTLPKTYVELGRAVELDTVDWLWKWTKKDNFVIAASTSGKRLFIFPKPKEETDQRAVKNALSLFKRFNHRNTDQFFRGSINNLKRKASKAIHVIYNSDKFGPAENYIHTFESMPAVWVDRTNNPKIVALIGGNTRITTRGIEG